MSGYPDPVGGGALEVKEMRNGGKCFTGWVDYNNDEDGTTIHLSIAIFPANGGKYPYNIVVNKWEPAKKRWEPYKPKPKREEEDIPF